MVSLNVLVFVTFVGEISFLHALFINSTQDGYKIVKKKCISNKNVHIQKHAKNGHVLIGGRKSIHP